MAARHARTIIVAGVVTGGATAARNLRGQGSGSAAEVVQATGRTIGGTFVVVIALQLLAEAAPRVAVGIAWLTAATAVTFAANDIRTATQSALAGAAASATTGSVAGAAAATNTTGNTADTTPDVGRSHT